MFFDKSFALYRRDGLYSGSMFTFAVGMNKRYAICCRLNLFGCSYYFINSNKYSKNALETLHIAIPRQRAAQNT